MRGQLILEEPGGNCNCGCHLQEQKLLTPNINTKQHNKLLQTIVIRSAFGIPVRPLMEAVQDQEYTALLPSNIVHSQ